MADKSSRLFRLVQERALSKKRVAEEKERREQNRIPYVPKDCVSNILVRLPLESLQRSRFVCKPWYKIINDSNFIDDHLSRSESTLIFLAKDATKYHPYSIPSVPKKNSNSFSVESKPFEKGSLSIFKQPLSNPKSIYKIQYMEIRDGKCEIIDYNATCLGQIRSSCNGVIIVDNMLKKGGLIAINPVTRKTIALPVGTICPFHRESYALTFSKSKNQFKLVHLFMDDLHHIGCEMLDIGKRSWRAVDGPCFGVINWFGFNSVHAIDALHWLPHVSDNEYIVSISIENENFHNILLPKRSKAHDRIVEIGGLLGFVTHEETSQIDVWVLRSLFDKEWTKQHSIVECVVDMVPLCCTKIKGELVFKSEKDRSLYVYNFRFGVMKRFEMEKGSVWFGICPIPHVNSLVSWETYSEGENMDD